MIYLDHQLELHSSYRAYIQIINLLPELFMQTNKNNPFSTPQTTYQRLEAKNALIGMTHVAYLQKYINLLRRAIQKNCKVYANTIKVTLMLTFQTSF